MWPLVDCPTQLEHSRAICYVTSILSIPFPIIVAPTNPHHCLNFLHLLWGFVVWSGHPSFTVLPSSLVQVKPLFLLLQWSSTTTTTISIFFFQQCFRCGEARGGVDNIQEWVLWQWMPEYQHWVSNDPRKSPKLQRPLSGDGALHSFQLQQNDHKLRNERLQSSSCSSSQWYCSSIWRILAFFDVFDRYIA